MSVRPQEAAETASRFSLRSVFAGSFEDTLESPKLHATPAPAAPPMQVPALNIAANPNSNLKFTLPQMRSTAALGGAAVGEKPGRHINAGFLSGGVAQASQETLRLNGMIADLHSKLDASAARYTEAQTAVDRANKRLHNDRSSFNARIATLSNELRAAQQRETAARAELAAAPRQSALDMERFKLQAEGAVELQAKYEEAVAHAQELEDLVAETNAAFVELRSKNAQLQDALAEAKMDAQQTANGCGDHSVEDAEVKAESEANSEEKEADEEASLEPKIEGAVEPASQAWNDEVAQKIEAHEATIKELEKSVAEADEIIKGNDKRMWELRAERNAALQASAEACSERDSISKELAASVTLRAEDEEALGRVTAAALEANEAAAAVAKAGANATPAMHAAAGRTLMMAKRLRASFETGLPAAPIVTLSVENKTSEPIEVVKVEEARQTLATGMNLGAGCFGIAAPALEQSRGIDLHCISAAECCTDASTAALNQHEQEALTQQQVRVNELVECISADLKWTLTQYATTFKTKTALA